MIAVYLRPDTTQAVKGRLKKDILTIQKAKEFPQSYLPKMNHGAVDVNEDTVEQFAQMFSDIKAAMRGKKEEFYLVLPDYMFAMVDCFTFDGESDIRSHIETNTHHPIDDFSYSKPIVVAPEPQQQLVTVCVLSRKLIDAINEAAKHERVQLVSIESASMAFLRATGVFSKEELSLYSFQNTATFIGYSSNGGLFKMDTPELSTHALSELSDLEAEQQIRQYMIEFENAAHQTYEYLNQDLPYTLLMPKEVIEKYPVFMERRAPEHEWPEFVHANDIEDNPDYWMSVVGTLLQGIDFNDEKYADYLGNNTSVSPGNVLPDEIKQDLKRFQRFEHISTLSRIGVVLLALVAVGEGAAIGFVSGEKVPQDLQKQYDTMKADSVGLKDELDIIGLAESEHEYPLEAYAAMTQELPEGVNFTSLEIGNNGTQDNSRWIKAKIYTDDPLKFQDYVNSLSMHKEFGNVSIPQFNTDTSSGYKTADMTIAKGKVGK